MTAAGAAAAFAAAAVAAFAAAVDAAAGSVAAAAVALWAIGGARKGGGTAGRAQVTYMTASTSDGATKHCPSLTNDQTRTGETSGALTALIRRRAMEMLCLHSGIGRF